MPKPVFLWTDIFVWLVFAMTVVYVLRTVRNPNNRRTWRRVTTLLESGKIAADLGIPMLNPADDRVMICGSPEMLRDLKHMMETRGFKEGNTTTPGDYVIAYALPRR